MENFDFRTVPKLICEGTAMGINRHFFSFAIKTGPGITSFAMVPEDAKAFAEGLKKTIELYEVQFGPIPETNKPVPSPIDMTPPGAQPGGAGPTPPAPPTPPSSNPPEPPTPPMP